MIRKWLKNIIKETLLESFPACNITIIDSEKSNVKLQIKGGTFVDSEIKISKEFAKEKVKIGGSNITQNKGTFICHGEDSQLQNETG